MGHSPYPFVYPAPAAILMAPFGALPWTIGVAAFAVVTLAATVCALRILGVRDWRCYGVALGWLPVAATTTLGALTTLLALGTAVAWRYRDRRFVVAAAIAAVVAVKVFLWPLLIWLIATRRFRTAATSVVMGVVLAVGCWAVIGFDGMLDYPRHLGGIASSQEARSFSPFALMRSLGLSNAASDAGLLVLGVTALGAILVVARHADGDRRGFVAAVGAAFVLSPIVWLHYFALLYVVVALYRKRLSAAWMVPLAYWLIPHQDSGGSAPRILGAYAITGVAVGLAVVPASRDWRVWPGERSLRAALSWAHSITTAGFLAVSALAMLVVSPRFTIGGLSLVDDWSGYAKSPHALERLVRLSYDPAAVGDPHRYRPASIAVWNGLVWHTLGAPGNLVGPNIWNTLRILLYVGSAMALLLASIPLTVRLRSRVVLAAGIPALVLATPAFGPDFARFGPAEPLLLGGMIGGVLLLVLATRRWLAAAPWWRIAPPLTAGYALWLFGVYQKETSVCFLVAAPFLYLFLDRRCRATGLIRRPLLADWRFQAVAVAAFVPVVHMTTEVWRVAAAGTTVYGQDVPGGAGGIVGRLVSGTATQWAGMTVTLGSPLWGVLSLVGLGLTARALRRREALDWLLVGFVLTGWSTLAFQALSGAETLSRYYLPSATLFGAATALALARSGWGLHRADLAVAGILVLLGGVGSYWSVRVWAANEREGNALVDRTAALNPQRCPVYMGRLEMELARATRVLVPLEGRSGTHCASGGDAMLIARRGPKPYNSYTSAMDDRIFAACRPPGWTAVALTRHFQLLACRRLADGTVRGEGVRSILTHDRLRPAGEASPSASAGLRAPS